MAFLSRENTDKLYILTRLFTGQSFVESKEKRKLAHFEN